MLKTHSVKSQKWEIKEWVYCVFIKKRKIKEKKKLFLIPKKK